MNNLDKEREENFFNIFDKARKFRDEMGSNTGGVNLQDNHTAPIQVPKQKESNIISDITGKAKSFVSDEIDKVGSKLSSMTQNALKGIEHIGQTGQTGGTNHHLFGGQRGVIGPIFRKMLDLAKVIKTSDKYPGITASNMRVKLGKIALYAAAEENPNLNINNAEDLEKIFNTAKNNLLTKDTEYKKKYKRALEEQEKLKPGCCTTALAQFNKFNS